MPSDKDKALKTSKPASLLTNCREHQHVTMPGLLASWPLLNGFTSVPTAVAALTCKMSAGGKAVTVAHSSAKGGALW